MEYENAVAQLKNARYCCRQLIKINEQIEVLYHRMTGLAHTGQDLDLSKASSSLPMPHFTGNPNRSPVALIQAIDAKREQAKAYRGLILACSWVERLGESDRKIAVELFLAKTPPEELAAELGYTKQGVYKRIKRAIEHLEE